MSNTPRNQWPYPNWNAAWQEWQNVFRDMVFAQDSTTFSNMEGSKNVFQSLPDCQIVYIGGKYYLTMTDDLVIISRTYNTRISIVNDDLELQPNKMVCAMVTAGAVGSQNTAFQLVDFAEIDPDLRVFGYVDESYGINWFNGSRFLPAEDARQIFSFLGTGGGGTDDKRVKVSAGDTTAAFLSEKLIEGTNITLTILDVGGNETLRIDSAGGGDATLEQYAIGYGDASNELYGDATYLYYNSNRQVGLGTGTPGHLSTTNDSLYIEGRLEVDGIGYFDSDLYVYGNEYLVDDKAVYFGNSQDAVFGYSSTSQTTDTLLLGLPATSNNMIITTKAGYATNWSKAIRTNPTLFLMSASASTSMYSAHSHDQSNALWESGYGSVGVKDTYIAASDYTGAYMPWAYNSDEWTKAATIGGATCSLLGLIGDVYDAVSASSPVLTAGAVGYGSASNLLTGHTGNLFYDATNHYFGINNASPTCGLRLGSSGTIGYTSPNANDMYLPGRIQSGSSIYMSKFGDAYLFDPLCNWSEGGMEVSKSYSEWNLILTKFGSGVTELSLFEILSYLYDLTDLTEGAVAYGDADDRLTGHTGNLFYDATNHYFGINNASPTCGLRLGSSGTIGYTSPNANDMYLPGRIQAGSTVYMGAFGDGYLFDPTCNWSESGMEVSKSYSEWNAVLTKFGGGVTEVSLFEALLYLYDHVSGGSLQDAYTIGKTITMSSGNAGPVVINSGTETSSLMYLMQVQSGFTGSNILYLNSANTVDGAIAFELTGSAGSIDWLGHRFAISDENISILSGSESTGLLSYLNVFNDVADTIEYTSARIRSQNSSASSYAYVWVQSNASTASLNIKSTNKVYIDADDDIHLNADDAIYVVPTGNLSINPSGYTDFNATTIRDVLNLSYGDSSDSTTWSTSSRTANFATGTPTLRVLQSVDVTTVTITRPNGCQVCCIKISASVADRAIGNASGCFKDASTGSTFINWLAGDGNPDTSAITIPAGTVADISIRYENISGTPVATGIVVLQ